MPTLTQPSPPHDLNAEKAVLAGALVYGDETVSEIASLCSPTDFFDRRHVAIFQAMLDAQAKDLAVDEVTVCSRLNSTGQLGMVGGATYVSQLAEAMPGKAQVVSHAKLVAEKSATRQALGALRQGERELMLGQETCKSVVGKLQEGLSAAVERTQGSELVQVGLATEQALAAYEQRKATGQDSLVIPLGFAALDRKLSGGLRPGNLCILAARPSMGKTSFALGCAYNIARRGECVLFVSLEMTDRELTDSIICAQAGVPTDQWASGMISREQERNVQIVTRTLEQMPLYFMSRGVSGVPAIATYARSLKARRGLSLVVVDYLQLLTQAVDNVTAEVSAISGSLKRLASDLSVPVMALSQLNRAVEMRDDKHPRLADLRQSGSLEQDANQVLMLYRPGYYADDPNNVLAEVGVLKHRGGPTGAVDMAFIPQYTRFAELDRS